MKTFLWELPVGCALFLLSAALANAALQPGPAQSGSTNGTFTLENNFLAVSWVTTNGTLLPLEFANTLATQSWTQAGAELFSLVYTSIGSDETTSSVSLTSSNLILVSGPQLQASEPNSQSTRVGDQLPGQELVASFLDPPSGIQVDWRAALRDGANYILQFLTIHGTNSSETITSVELLHYTTASPPAQAGTVAGSPVVAGQAFFGGETPFAANILTDNSVRISVPTSLPLGSNITYGFSSVAGVFPVGQLRRSFLYYLERERAAPYRQLLHFNSWDDAARNVNESEMLTNINACELELHHHRGVALDSYVMDDGWYDPTLGFWAIDTNKFPNQFNLLQSTVTADGSHLGIWISPLGGYLSWQQELIQDAIKQGIITSNLDLSIPTYYTWWTNECGTFILSNAVNYFKWDGAGTGVSPHFMALLRAADALRGYATNDLFINVTVGTWPSPFWLHSVDSTWRQGGDTGLAGIGDAREQWITYRDGQTYQNIVQQAPLYPVTSLMLGGIILTSSNGVDNCPAISAAGTDLRHETRTLFGSGVNLQELAITSSMLTSDSWNNIAEAAAWARTNASVLVDSHWVGGDPNNLEVYGWASWSTQKCLVVLRNPSSQANCIAFDIGAALELPAGASTTYNLSPSYSDQRATLANLNAGQPAYITFLPFEVLSFDALPVATAPQAPSITVQLSPMTRYVGASLSIAASAQGTLPIYYQWRSNGVSIVNATNATLVLSNLQFSASANYTVTASNSVGTSTSAMVPLTVQTPSAYAATILADGPVAYWRLDDTGPTAQDSSGNHNGMALGTATSNVTFGVAGALANDPDTATHFAGVCNNASGKLRVPYYPELNTSNFSFECWARVTGGAGTYRSPLTSRCSNNGYTGGYVFYAGSADDWEFWTPTSYGWDVIYGSPVVSGQWVHLVGTYNAANSSKAFYVNGALVGSHTSPCLPNTNTFLFIGAGANEINGGFFFIGDIDEVAIYDHALSAAHVQAHYLAGVPPPPPPPTSILIFNVTGGGAYWTNGIGVAIGLDGSQSGVSYQLQWNGNNLGSPVAGTGSAMSFGHQTTAGIYTVVATAVGTGDTTTMSGSATVTISPLPAALLEWQMRYFNCTNCAQAQMSADADASGQNNLFKFVAGLDPTNPASVFVLQIQNVPNQPTQKNLIYGPIASGCTYVVESTTNLLAGVWSPQAVSVRLTNGLQVTVTDLNATDLFKFYRVHIYNIITNIMVQDSLGDGISDSWRAQYFPTVDPTGTTTSNVSCATCDADGTGQNNLFKYVAGLDPTNSTSVFVLKIASVDGQPTQKKLAFSPWARGRTYTTEFKTDLRIGSYTALPDYSGPSTNASEVSVTDLNATPASKFYRIRITYP